MYCYMKRIGLLLQMLLIAAFFCNSSLVRADEGMWMVGNLSARTDSVMRALGLELSHKEVFNPYAPSLNDAIVMFGGYCSGVVVSSDGLVFTNHHCGFMSIQKHSATEHDYLKDGFFAKRLKDELPNDGLYVVFHLNTIDVTDRVLEAVSDTMDMEERNMAIMSCIYNIEAEAEDSIHGIYGSVTPYYRGSKYYLSVYQQYDDVRLVFAPPQCLGKFGGDTDNWMWPRQTCDFSVFRIYAGKDNQPAKYSKDNQPYHPKGYAHVSTQGYQPGSYCMTLGYPGSTDRYLSSYGINHTMRTKNDLVHEVRGVKLDILSKAMKADAATRIKYASKYASLSNYWKNALGQNTALENLGVIREKQELEREVNEWLDSMYAAFPDSADSYENVLLDSLKSLYEKSFDYAYGLTLLDESFTNSSDILRFVLLSTVRKVDDESMFVQQMEETYKDIDIDLDRQVFAAAIRNYMKMARNPELNPDFMQEIDTVFGGDVDAFTDNLYSRSRLCQSNRLAEITSIDSIFTDPMFDIATDVLSKLYMASGYDSDGIDECERMLGDAIRAMNHDKEYYPDANFTMRLSFGKIKPLNGGYFTQPQSLIDKNDAVPFNDDYELLPSVSRWLRKGDFGERYVDRGLGLMPLCFLSDNDITGGNSGSGMFDGKGRLIGLAFDGNWEALSGDYKFDSQLQRCIGVDIRYVLSVIEKYGKGKRLIRELTLE